MDEAELLTRVDKLRVWQQQGERAPHKPLLVLLALGRFELGEIEIRYEWIREHLSNLLREFGPPRRPEPRLPFWHLQTDQLWTVHADNALQLADNGRPREGDLRRLHARGGFPEDVQARLRASPHLVPEISRRILQEHFPPSIHEDILQATGLPSTAATTRQRPRDRSFRESVLTTYGYRCAMCGLGLRMADRTIGLEAAHIKWHQAGGPDTPANGLALCCLHHKVFDLGAFTVADGKAVVSSHVHADTDADGALLRFHGTAIRRPTQTRHEPAAQFLDWHRSEVFRGEALA